MANGKVCTGFSKPYVALYSAEGGTVTYSNGQILARGVDVSISPEVADDNVFYADNIAAETVPGVFTGGTCALTVDGLLIEAEKLIMGLPAAVSETVGGNTVDIYEYGDNIQIPYVGIGFIVRYQSAGVEMYTPVVLTKARFATFETAAATAGESIDWQTQSLSAQLMRDDSANHVWKKVGADQSTEAEAEAVVRALLQIV